MRFRHRFRFLTAGVLVVLVLEHLVLRATLRDARRPRARPTYQQQVHEPRHLFERRGFGGGVGRGGVIGRGIGGGVGTVGGGVGVAAVGGADRVGVVVVRVGLNARRFQRPDQRHAVDAVFGAGKRQPRTIAGRRRFSFEHDQPPVVQNGQLFGDGKRIPVVLVAGHPSVRVEENGVWLERLRLVGRPQEFQFIRHPPENGRDTQTLDQS